MKTVIFMPAFAGKTTLHRDGRALDPEELAEYRPWKEGWADQARANSPTWRREQQQAFAHLLRKIQQGGELDKPVVTHPPQDAQQLGAWRDAGWTTYGFVPPDLLRRAQRAIAADPSAVWATARLRAMEEGTRTLRKLNLPNPPPSVLATGAGPVRM